MKAVFHRKTFIWSLGLCLLLIVNIGMSLMFLSIMFGMPIFVSMAALFGGILLALVGGSPIMMLVLAGISMIIAGILVFTVKEKNQ